MMRAFRNLITGSLMRKIVLLKSPGNLNIGNEFINVGTEYLVRKSLDAAGLGDYDLCVSEFWASNMSLQKYPTNWNTEGAIQWMNDSDLILIAGGAIVNKYMEGFLRDVGAMKPPKILLGASMFSYNDAERKLAKDVLAAYDHVVCRDNLLHETIQDVVSSRSGIDPAFFLNDVHQLLGLRGKYGVVNMDLNLRQRMRARRKYEELKEQYGDAYITENTATWHKNIEGFIFLSRWSEFCNLYGNAAFVSTTRVHTALLCTIFATPFEYLGSDAEPNAKRSSLFHQVGMSLETGRQYQAGELEGYANIIEQKKQETMSDLSSAIASLLGSS